ncbi:MAG: NUDIX domain-containing protein [Chloroflexi bacterium]|nr:NUDIX domain-containing protein [Chloroflexota bacterium]
MMNRGGRERPICPLCGWTYYAKNATGAAVAITEQGRLLLVQRKYPPFAGSWTLPAGYVEYGDSACDTAVREAREECGLEVQLDGLAGVYFGADDPRDAAHLIVYAAHIVGGGLRPDDDAAQVEFFSPNALPEEIAFEGQRAAIRDWKQNHSTC